MADDRHVVALTVATHRIIANALHPDYPTAPEWENYSAIAESDWRAIQRMIYAEVVNRHDVKDEEYDAAYEFLDARADAE